MGDYRPPRPTGTSRFHLFMQAVHDRLFGGKFPFIDTDSVKWERGASGYSARASLPSAGGKAAPAVPAEIAAFVITNLNGKDFFTGQKIGQWVYSPNLAAGFHFTASPYGGPSVKIAKPGHLRPPFVAETIDGVLITYRNGPAGSPLLGFDDNNRIANDGVTDEVQCVYPRYVPINDPLAGYIPNTVIRTTGLAPGNVVISRGQSVVYAMKVPGGSGVFDYTNLVNGKPDQVDWQEILPARVWSKRFVT